MKENLIEKAKTIIEELKLKNAKITDKWMAHYVTELIEEYESSTNSEKKLEIGRECKGLIIILWKFMLREKEIEIERVIGEKRKKMNKDLESLSYFIEKSKKNPEDVKNLEVKEKINLMQIISDEEKDLFYFFKVSTHFSLVKIDKDSFSPREIGLFNEYKEQISKYFTFFKDVSIDNYELTKKRILYALGFLNYLRNLCFSSEN